MAKFGVYFGLCPLIDQKSFLGVSEDLEKDCVIVTMGKKFAVKYKISDQKQIHSWSSREPFTSKLIFDKRLKQYLGVFNYNFIRIFGSDCDNFDLIKKHKFKIEIHSLLPSNEESIVLFKNGTISLLQHALETKTDSQREPILSTNEQIIDEQLLTINNEQIVCLFTTIDDNVNYYGVPIENSIESRERLIKIPLCYNQLKLSGYCVGSQDNTDIVLYTLWEDGKLFLYSSNMNVEFPGIFLSVLTKISCNNQTSLISLNNNHLAILGNNYNQDGASIIIYNNQYQIEQCREMFKMYQSNTKIFNIDMKYLLFTVGHSLAVLPYSLGMENLVDLIGSNKLSNKIDGDISIVCETEFADWDNKGKPKISIKVPEEFDTSFKIEIKRLITEGCTEVLIFDELLLDLINKKQISYIEWMLNNFQNISEKLIVRLLIFFFTNTELFYSNTEQLSYFRSLKCCKFLTTIINLNFDDIKLLKYLREYLDLTIALKLLQYTCSLIDSCQNFVSENVVIMWMNLIIDSQYQKILLARSNSEVFDTLNRCLYVIKTKVTQFNELKLVESHLMYLKSGRQIQKNIRSKLSKVYSVEEIQWY